MPPVIKLNDQDNLIDASSYPHAKFPFEKFNPVQSRLFEYYDKDINVLIASATSSGKTVCSELMLAYEIRVRKNKGMYLAPLKALAQEKYDEWTTNHFSDLKVSICTGDYKLTAARKKELEDADLIIMSNEMFNHRVRNYKSENNEFLKKVKTLVSDESHLLTVPSRGDHLENGMMQYTDINPDCRLILLSATMPNVEELADWLSYVLTKKQTILIKSSYRPCPLNVHYETYYDKGRYEDIEISKIGIASEIVKDYPEDKFLIFAHTKRTGELMKKSLLQCGIECEFHSADLDKDSRIKLEKKFKDKSKLRVIVATSTLAWGCNLPARRVIILGVHRGLSEVETYDITQMLGRSGRPAYDPVGDAYILLPESPDKYTHHKKRIQTPQNIQSQLLEKSGNHYKVLAFHLISKIHHREVETKEDIHKWYERSLAHFQAKELGDDIVEQTVDSLLKCGAIKIEDNKYMPTSVGVVASLFYYSPFDVSDLKKNFTKIFSANKEDDDLFASLALANLDTHRCGIVSKIEREEMGRYLTKVNENFGVGTLMDPAIKAGYAYYILMNGMSTTALAAMTRNLQFDYPRLDQVLNALDSMASKWNKKTWFRKLRLRITYGVKGDAVYLCQLPNVGKVRAQKLWDAGIKTTDDVANNPEKIKSILKLKQESINEIVLEAQKIKLVGDV